MDTGPSEEEIEAERRAELARQQQRRREFEEKELERLRREKAQREG